MSSLYRIVEDSDSRLVLRGRKVALWLLTLFLLVNASVLLYVGLLVAGRRQLFPAIGGSALGVFFAVCGVAALVKTLRYESRIEIVRDSSVVRLLEGRIGLPTEIPFARIASVELEAGSREHRVFLLDTEGGEWLIDRSRDARRMAALAARIRDLTSDRSPREEPPGAATVEDATSATGPDAIPDGISVASRGNATIYSWRTLPRTPFWVFFWGFVTLLLGSLAGIALAGMVIEMARLPPILVLAFLALVLITLGLMYFVSRRVRRRGTASLGVAVLAVTLANLLIGSLPFVLFGAVAATLGYITSLCAFVLLARCRLRLSPAQLRYEERVLGLPLSWRRRSLAATEVSGFRIKAATRGGGAVEVCRRGGQSFTLMIPQGTGAFSRRDLEWLRARWLEGLAGERNRSAGCGM